MSEPTQADKPTNTLINTLDQLSSINAFADVQIGNETVKIQITSRHGITAELLAADVEAFINAFAIVRTNHPKPELPTPSAPKADPASAAVASTNPEMAAALQKQYEEVGNPPAGKTWLTFDAEIVKVLPQPDNKVTIEFYGAADKYPRVKVNKWKLEQADGLMKYVTSETMAKAAEYKLHCRVFYTEGNAYTTTDGKSGHYKDVAHVRTITPF